MKIERCINGVQVEIILSAAEIKEAYKEQRITDAIALISDAAEYHLSAAEYVILKANQEFLKNAAEKYLANKEKYEMSHNDAISTAILDASYEIEESVSEMVENVEFIAKNISEVLDKDSADKLKDNPEFLIRAAEKFNELLDEMDFDDAIEAAIRTANVEQQE